LGKPFELEISKLPETYCWARSIKLNPIDDFVRMSRYRGLFAVGSGGSFSVATYAAYLHQRYCHQASAVTPLEFLSSPPLRRSAVLLYSAGGKNSDVVAALRFALNSEAAEIAVMCLRPDSVLSRLASKYNSLHSWSGAGPAGADGFLATNSLLAFFVLTHRLYIGNAQLPATYQEMLTAARVDSTLNSLIPKTNLVVLYSPSTKAAAVDLESKMSEAGLSSVQLADFRNFGHGRHNWVAKKPKETGVLALIARDAADIGEQTLHVLKNICATTAIRTDVEESLASLACLPRTFELTRLIGQFRGIDPGRPGVPAFGRRIYHLRAESQHFRPGAPPPLDTIVDRKLSLMELACVFPRRKWRAAAKRYAKQIGDQTFRAIIFDFDDTLCGPSERYGILCPEIVSELSRLARAGMRLGIATGRGKSVRIQLRKSLREKYWRFFSIAYYNGTDIGTLTDESMPERGEPSVWFVQLGRALNKDRILGKICEVTIRKQQITVESRNCISTEWLWREVLRVTAKSDKPVQVTHSTRSVDIVPRGVSKLSLLKHFVKEGISAQDVLCIGDLGEFPGNDFELLQHTFSISSDRPSVDADSCWNFAPVGFRGVQATSYYLRKLRAVAGGVRMELPNLR
jgi:HAD superfamily hydrolase (TIGR01484 family)